MHAAKKLPSHKYLQESLRYVPETGKLFWRKRPRRHFANKQSYSRWNNRYANQEAFTHKHAVNGGKYGAVGGQFCVAHRVIWKLVTGKEPSQYVDHKDRNRANNKWINLRLVKSFENSINRKRHKNNKTGVVGVYFSANERKWKTSISLKNTRIFLGTFKNKSAAVCARYAAERRYHKNFSPRHA